MTYIGIAHFVQHRAWISKLLMHVAGGSVQLSHLCLPAHLKQRSQGKTDGGSPFEIGSASF